jgi:hypothetical protein
MVARAVSLRTGGVGVANVDIWPVAADGGTCVASDHFMIRSGIQR